VVNEDLVTEFGRVLARFHNGDPTVGHRGIELAKRADHLAGDRGGG
jgi:hypothetical protein